MRVPESWLREYVADAPDLEAIAERLAIVGTEVERIIDCGVPRDGRASEDGGAGYRVGRVVSFGPHPDADRLRQCIVDVGEVQPRQIVCGASNFDEGDTVAVVLPGAVLPDGTAIRVAKLRGVESRGMMLSERELGLGNDHNGIMICPPEWEIGTPLDRYVPLGDRVLELEITSNRPDCLSVHGIAREVSAAFDIDLADIDTSDADCAEGGDIADHVSVEVEAPDLCGRYMARAFTDVQIGPSPAWIKTRLINAGMRPINNVVDVTNYVMLMCGQPLHAFDADRIEGRRIIVRRARPGETVTTLDDVSRSLDESMLVIADASRTAVIAGVMGAADVEVGDATRSIVLEAAHFDGPSIIATSGKLALRSESSTRFEKGLDPLLPEVAMRLASRLLVEVCGARMVPGTIDVVRADLPGPVCIQLDRAMTGRVLGVDVPVDQQVAILTRLGYVVDASGDDALVVTVPHWRMFDTTRPIDLVEEIGRIFGLDKVPARRPASRSEAVGLTSAQQIVRLIEDAAAGMGLHECVTYSLVPAGEGVRFGSTAEDVVALDNPMTSDHAEMRTMLLPSMLRVVRSNMSVGTDDVLLFEVGRAFSAAAAGDVDARGLQLWARERHVIGLCMAGSLPGGRFDDAAAGVDLSAITGVVATLLHGAGVASVDTAVELRSPTAERSFLHPARIADVWIADRLVGWAGEVHPTVVDGFDIRGRVVAAELDLSIIVDLVPDMHLFTNFSSFPCVRQDIALVMGIGVAAGTVLDVVRESGSDLLESVEVFDRYEGAAIPDGSYSLALRLTFRADDRTLTDAEVGAVRTEIVDALARQCGATLRA